MGAPEREPLKREVEVDELFLGGYEEGLPDGGRAPRRHSAGGGGRGRLGYDHRPLNHSAAAPGEEPHPPRAHRAISNLKAWAFLATSPVVDSKAMWGERLAAAAVACPDRRHGTHGRVRSSRSLVRSCSEIKSGRDGDVAARWVAVGELLMGTGGAPRWSPESITWGGVGGQGRKRAVMPVSAGESGGLVRDVLLRDGSTSRLEAPVPADFDQIKAFYDGLSEESRYLRFHGAGRSDIVVRRLRRRVALMGCADRPARRRCGGGRRRRWAGLGPAAGLRTVATAWDARSSAHRAQPARGGVRTALASLNGGLRDPAGGATLAATGASRGRDAPARWVALRRSALERPDREDAAAVGGLAGLGAREVHGERSGPQAEVPADVHEVGVRSIVARAKHIEGADQQ